MFGVYVVSLWLGDRLFVWRHLVKVVATHRRLVLCRYGLVMYG